jgi:3',5'-cyclic-nucleotide phosphodiesterase
MLTPDAENLTGFLVASRSAYNAFVPYHNFRHVVDVLQAIFHFLVRLGRLPRYPYSSSPAPAQTPSPIAALIRPFDALTLLITAIGHDVGHPGVNNAFLVTLNAPLAQLYNDRSVLESFHCAAYSQILRRHWPAAFSGVEMRQLMISSILATDMGLHFDYMKKLGFLQEKLHENGGTDGWNGRLLEEQRTLACGLLIKCADISNVVCWIALSLYCGANQEQARQYDVAAQWTIILTDEFARQASMEKDLGIPSALFAAPVREIIELGKSQIGFMNMFAIPLFQGVTDVMPGMEFCVEELHRNKSAWELKIKEEQEKFRQDSVDSGMMDGMFSPRTMSVATPSDASHQKTGSATLLTLGSETDLRIKALLNKKSPFTYPTNAFASSNGIFDESEEQPHHHSLPELSTQSMPAEESAHPSPSEVTPESSSRRSSKPSQLQLSYATTSAPGLVDHPSQDTELVVLNGEHHPEGLDVKPSLVTDAVVAPASPIEPRKTYPTTDKQRSSDTTEGSNSASGDWASQATSATTSKMPLSPSTQGTSITSEDSMEKGVGTSGQTPTCVSPLASAESQTSTTTGSVEGGSHSSTPPETKGTVLMETVRNLKKRPSRFRMNSLNFWKRSKSSSPPMPNKDSSGGPVGGSEDDALSVGKERSCS